MSTHHPARTCPAATRLSRVRRRALGAFLLVLAAIGGWGALAIQGAAAPAGFSQAAALPGLGSGRIWSVAVEPSVPSTIIAGTDAGIYASHDGGGTWVQAVLGVRVWTVGFDIRHPGNAFAGTNGKGVYASVDAGGSTGGDLYRSTDGGLTFHKADTGLPGSSKNIDSISVANTTPPEVVVAVNPPTGGSHVYIETDTGAPAPPKLIPESPGAAVPSAVATPVPTPTPKPVTSHATAPPPPPSGIQRFAQAAFHWPTPLVYEVFFLLLALYVYIRWRQRYYVDGPP